MPVRTISIGFNTMDVYDFKKTMYPGGNELNTSIYAKWNGADSAYLGYFGDDARSRHLEAVLEKNGVDISRCRHVSGVSGIAITTLVDGNRVFLRTNGGGASGKNPILLEERDLDYIAGFRVAMSGRYARVSPQELEKIRSRGVAVAYDFSEEFQEEDLARFAPYCDLAFLSCSERKEEASALLRKVHGYGAGIVTATLGASGQMLFDGLREYSHGASPAQVVDTIGAGDSFAAAFTVSWYGSGLSREERIQAALEAGSRFAAKVCGFYGSVEEGIPYEDLGPV